MNIKFPIVSIEHHSCTQLLRVKYADTRTDIDDIMTEKGITVQVSR